MENLFHSIQTLQRRLNDAGISSIVIGGVAVAVWGEPRVTRDVDLKVLMGRDEAEQLLAALAPDYVSLLSDARTALRQQAMVFVQDAAGTRLDLLLADTPYDVLAVHLLRAEVGACSDSVWRGRRKAPASLVNHHWDVQGMASSAQH